jgi:hypothetical protein
MTRKEAMRLTHQADALRALGFTSEEAESLRRISMTLHRWHELECGDGNGHIERDEKTGTPRYLNSNARYIDPHDPRAWHVIPDREKGALKRLAKILNARLERQPVIDAAHDLTAYIQTDPRGAALYILRPGDVPAGADASAYYNRGVCVY